KLLNFSLWYLGWPKLDRLLGGVDVIFLPNISFASISRRAKLILTIHDLSFERCSEFFSWKRRLWHIFLNPRKLSKRADRIIAVSESTKNDLVRLYGAEKEKIQVISSGVNDKFKKIDRNDPKLVSVKEKYGLPWNFILYLGTLEPRKNAESLIRAFGSLKKEARDLGDQEIMRYKLVLAGSSGWLEKGLTQRLEESEFREDIILTKFIQEEDKVFVYNLASLFVYPSFLEGFGFPPLEAQRSEVPVIVSANSSFPETVGEGALMIDPDRPTEIKEAIKILIKDKKLREEMIRKGKRNSERFSWRVSAEKFSNLLKQI
ncbi:MAG: glycosyltransferase family 4 protein, partial [Patescibacteria group bacterium]